MLNAEIALGYDLAHNSCVLGRSKLARVVPPAEKSLRECSLFILLHPFAGNRLSWIRNAPDVVATLAQDCLVVLPESGRRWFIDDHSGATYEQYLIDDLIPLVRAEYPTRPISIGGFSMGGAAAFFLALRHPDLFVSALAVAGAFFAADRQGDPYRAVRSAGLMIPTVEEHDRVWGPPGSPARARYDPCAMVEKLGQHFPASRFHFEVGNNDFPRVVEASERMRDLFGEAGIEFAFSCQAGDHSWDYAAKAMTRLIEQSRHWSL